MTNSTIICVLGMARSGTSLTTKMLNLMGVYLGREENLPKPRVYNPRGTWEHKLIHKLNEEILSRLGGNWFTPPDFPPGWENAPEFEDLREQALTVIQKDFTAAEIWGWKDPRTCLTLPFWQQLLPPMRYVICLRNPLDVVLSLERFVGCTLEKGFYLWLLYTKFALEHSVGQQRILISFEDLVNDWQNELQRLSRFLDKPDLAMQAELKNAVQATIDEKLQHHHTSIDALTNVLRVYENFSRTEPFQQNNLDQELQKVLDIVGPEAKRKEAWKKRIEYNRWMERLHLSTQEIAALIPPGESFILVDDGKWGYEVVTNRRAIPFLERDGQYWGSPPDNQTAIQEFERLRQSGARFIVFGWPAFWWLDYYVEFDRYLRSKFRCVLRNDRLVVFDLRS